MLHPGFLTLLMALALAGLLAYRSSFFHKRIIWNLSLQQVFLLIVAPGFIFPVAFNYLHGMLVLPRQENVFLSDKFLVSMTLMALLFTYGGLAIHAITKMLSDYLRNDLSELAEINKYFHLQFSHNLIFAGSVVVLLGFTLLELNHAPTLDSSHLFSGGLKGLFLGISFMLAMRNYTKFMGDNYFGKWNDLKFVFVVAWMGFMILLYGIVRLDPAVDEYQFLLPSLISFAFMTLMSLVLAVRRLKRGGVRVMLRRKNIHHLNVFEDFQN